MAWWTEARFGLFVHWGISALAARREWVQSRERLTDEAYRRYFERFHPDLFDPRAWARAASRAGMRHVVVTTKHHDGFCLWDSDLTEDGPSTGAGPASSRRRPTAATRGAATGSTSTCSPGPTATCTCPAWVAASYAQLLHDASEVAMRVVEPGQQPQGVHVGGLPEGTLTLELPAVPPPVPIAVVELFLRG